MVHRTVSASQPAPAPDRVLLASALGPPISSAVHTADVRLMEQAVLASLPPLVLAKGECVCIEVETPTNEQIDSPDFALVDQTFNAV